MEGHTTATAIIQMHDQWMEYLKAGKKIGVSMYDQAAAFNVCDYAILIEKLKILGVKDQTLESVDAKILVRKNTKCNGRWTDISTKGITTMFGSTRRSGIRNLVLVLYN